MSNTSTRFVLADGWDSSDLCPTCQTTRTHKGSEYPAAHGPATVCTPSHGPECHAASAWHVTNLSGTPSTTGITPRERVKAEIHAFWARRGILRTSCPRTKACPWYAAMGWCDHGGLHVRDVVNTDASHLWLPLHSYVIGNDENATDKNGESINVTTLFAEHSHVIAAVNYGAFCACNIVPENAARNRARDGDMVPGEVSEAVWHLLRTRPADWETYDARPASLRRYRP